MLYVHLINVGGYYISIIAFIIFIILFHTDNCNCLWVSAVNLPITGAEAEHEIRIEDDQLHLIILGTGAGDMKLVISILYMHIVYISLIDKCELMTCILYACIVSKVMIG